MTCQRFVAADACVSGRIEENPDDESGEVEIRPVFESEDFGKELTPELRAQEERRRAETARRQ